MTLPLINGVIQSSLFQSTPQHLITVWCGLEQPAVDDAIGQWQRPLLACVDAITQAL